MKRRDVIVGAVLMMASARCIAGDAQQQVNACFGNFRTPISVIRGQRFQ